LLSPKIDTSIRAFSGSRHEVDPRGYDAEFGQLAFLRAVWEKAAEATKQKEI
jgi:hypothetical protein